MHVTGMTKAQLYSGWSEGLDTEAAERFQALLKRRLKGEPLAYVLGHSEFYGRDFLVDQRVLIPRPETELLVEAALAWADTRRAGACPPPHSSGIAGGGPQGPALRERLIVADVGTGSGIIAVSLAAERPVWDVYAIDRSAEALEVARANAEKHGVRVTFLEGDLVDPLPKKVDLIVANLPYVRNEQLPQWCGAAQVELSFEPFDALCGGDDGLDVIRRFLPESPRFLKPDGAIFMEIAYDQGRTVPELAAAAFPEASISVTKDLAGLDRIVSIT